MFQYKRLNMMFHHISKNEYTPVSNLQSLLNISDRTIRNDIQEINSILSAYGAMVKLKRNYGYYIEVSDDKKYSEFLNTFKQHDNKRMNIDSSTERIKYILNVLLSSDDYISLDDLEYITKPSLGVKIIGSEEQIRKLYAEYILSSDFNEYVTSFTEEERSIFNKIDLNKICHRKDFLTTHFHPKNPRHPDIKPQESPRVSSFYLLQDTPDKRSLRHLV